MANVDNPIVVNPGAGGVTEVKIELGADLIMKYQDGHLIFTYHRNLNSVKLMNFSDSEDQYKPGPTDAAVIFYLGPPMPD